MQDRVVTAAGGGAGLGNPTAAPTASNPCVGTSGDVRVLRRLVPLDRRIVFGPMPATVAGCAIDVETTGLDHRRHSVVELAMQRFRADATGRIVDVGRPHRWLEDPGTPLPAEITRLTGITDEHVAGRSITDATAISLLLDADFVVAHNAAFDRPFVEKRLPDAAGRPWLCSLQDVDWRGLGFEGRVLSHLLSQIGWFYDAHRADVDVAALIRLLDHAPAGSGRTILSLALEAATSPAWIIEAVGAPFEAKDALKERGYRWNPERRFWWRQVSHEAFDDELCWATVNLYGGSSKPRFRRVDWTTRYSAAER